MHDVKLTEITLVVLAALAGGLGLARLKQPPILGYIITGVILGPSGFAFIQSRSQVSVLAELGVLLLLFVVGMELSLRTFKRVWVVALLCSLIQIAVSVGITLFLSSFFNWSIALSLLLGFVVSLSSTAVVVKMMETIGELKTDTGQITIGILIAQDLAIVPMLLILKNYSTSLWSSGLIFKIVFSLLLIGALITHLSRRQRVRLPLIEFISGDKELTSLASLAICFAAATASGLLGLSAPYGAFLAGLTLGNTHERLIILDTIKPIQSILLMVFFLSIGLLLDVQFIYQHMWTIILLLSVITVVKTGLNVLILRILRLPWSQAFLIGVMLAQLGEFAFLMAAESYKSGIINEMGQKLIISLTVLSLSFSPLWMLSARRLKNLANTTHVSLRILLKFLYGHEFSIFKHFIRHWHRRLMYPTNYHHLALPPPTSKVTTPPGGANEYSSDEVE